MSANQSGDPDARLSRLMAASQNGDRVAYASLLRECIPLIRRFAGPRVTRDTLDDVVQEVLMSLHKARHTYDPSRPFAAWLRAIVERRAIDVYRRAARQGAREVHAPVPYESHVDPGGTPETSMERSDRRTSIRDAVATLPPNQREAVETLVLNERSLREAAALTGKSEGAIKVSLHRAIKALRLIHRRRMDPDNV